MNACVRDAIDRQHKNGRQMPAIFYSQEAIRTTVVQAALDLLCTVLNSTIKLSCLSFAAAR